MYKKISKPIQLMPKQPKENQMLCEDCNGIGWLVGEGEIAQCNKCQGRGLIDLCKLCGRPTNGYCRSEKCEEERRQREESRRYEKAIKMKFEDVPDEHKEMMFSDVYSGDGYFTDFEELFEYCDDLDIPYPKYVWSTSSMDITLDAQDIVERACEELHEDAFEQIKDLDELQDFLDVWCAKQKGTTCYVDDGKYAIEVPKE
ncbi:hypothetical protein M2146_002561 [Lachnospiraceae bacterium PF1-22]